MANSPPRKALSLEAAESSAPAGDAMRRASDQSASTENAKRDLRISTSDEFLAQAAKEYQEGRIDQALWRRAADQGANDASLVIAAMRLNHILVGILLLPLGVSTFWSGNALGQSWGLRLAGLNAVTLLCLPVLLVTTMPLESLDAPLFRLAILVLMAACLIQILVLVGVWRSRQKQS